MCLSGPDRSKESTLAVLVVYHHTGGTCIDPDVCVLTFGSHVVGERVCIGATGLNRSVLNLSSEGSAHGCCVGPVVAVDGDDMARVFELPSNLVIGEVPMYKLTVPKILASIDDVVVVDARDCICT